MKKVFYLLSIFVATLTSCTEQEETKKEDNQPNVEKETPIENEEIKSDSNEVSLPEGWELTTTSGMSYLAVLDSATQEEMVKIGDKMSVGYGKVIGYMTTNGIEFAGAPITHWISWEPEGYSVFAIGIPVDPSATGNDEIRKYEIPSSDALKYNYFGSYEGTEDAHMSINDYFEASGTDPIGGPWEVYLTDPSTESDTTKWQTEIWYPVSK